MIKAVDGLLTFAKMVGEVLGASCVVGMGWCLEQT